MAATFEVPTTQIYVSASTGGRYRFFAGDLIPLDQAIDMGMEGAAAAAATTPFSAAENAWLAALDAAVLAAAAAADDVIQAAGVNAKRLTEARTATAAPGGTTGLITDGVDTVIVTSDNADKVITLPDAAIGDEITLRNGATGYELRTHAPATVAINGGAEADAESAIGANVTTVCRRTTATAWVCTDYSTAGVVSASEVAAAGV